MISFIYSFNGVSVLSLQHGILLLLSLRTYVNPVIPGSIANIIIIHFTLPRSYHLDQ